MYLLSGFQTITKLVVQHDGALSALDLYHLKDLPELTHLDLQHGSFEGIEVAEHLTALDLSYTTVVCEQGCSFVTSLVHLTMCHAEMDNFHQKGLPACSRLQSFTCEGSGVSAVDAAEVLICSRDADLTIP